MKQWLVAAVMIAGCGVASAQKNAAVVGVDPQDSASLLHALSASGLNPTGAMSASDALVVMQPRGKLDDATIQSLRTYVDRGGSLLLGLDEHPGSADTQLAFMLPTTAWSTEAQDVSRPLMFAPIVTGEGDVEMFGGKAPPAFDLPYWFPIRPVSAVERGIARYDRYLNDSPASFYAHPAGQFWWTRPLINRDWKVRLRANDRAKSPLLITGRYGAGRVAVFASGLSGSSPAQQAMWKPVIAWLSSGNSPGTEPAAGAVTFAAGSSADQPGSLRVTLTNHTAAPLSVQLLGRILTWELAYVGDSLQPASVPANGTATLDIALPKPGDLQYQAIDFKRAFVVRIGILSASGASLLSANIANVDASPSTGIELAADNLYRVNDPYTNAPGTDALPAWSNRMGTPVTEYAYLPGGTVHAKTVFTNGVHNIAPLAMVTDQTTPGNPSVVAINDFGARFNKNPRGGMEGYGTWNGKAQTDNVLRFHFPSPVTLTAITLVGSPAEPKNRLGHNPGAIVVECDGKSVLKNAGLDSMFVSEDGLVRLAFAPVQGSDVVVHLPWMALPGGKREAPSLGEIELEGSVTPLPSEIHGDATLILRDAMTGTETVIATKALNIPPGARVEWSQAVKLPDANNAFYQLQVKFDGQIRTIPVLAIQPRQTLTSILQAHPAHSPMESFVTTHGFAGLFPLGTDTREGTSPWDNPDDLIWAYERKTKQTGDNARTWTSSQYVTESNMSHYSTPWTFFPNGESVLQDGLPAMVEGMKRQGTWTTSKYVALGFGDRWDAGPSLPSEFDWPELVAFDQYLRDQHQPGLAGKTHAELNADINQHHLAEWDIWHEHRYVATVEMLRTTFADIGKELNMSGQGIPMTSNPDAAILSKTIRGMSSDSTWGMEGESVPFTTGRQLADQAFNPEWKLGYNFVWGYDSTAINNVFWYSPVGTTEPSRRHYYDVGWRGIVQEDGSYQSSFTYGYGNNGGEAWTMALNDYQQNWYAQQRFSLIYPEKPVGVGFLVSSAPVDSPGSTLFSGGGMGPDGKSEALVHRVALTFARLHDAGLDIPFTANILGVQKWGPETPYVLYDLGTATPHELAILKEMAGRGVRIAAFNSRGPLSPQAAQLMGLHPDGTPDAAKPVATIGPNTLVASGNLLFIPFAADDLTPEMSLQLAPALASWLKVPVTFPAGTMGYSFMNAGRTMIVLEDWQEQAREVSLRVHATGAIAHAVGLNDHTSLAVNRDGADWIIKVPMRAGDGQVVVLDQGAAR